MLLIVEKGIRLEYVKLLTDMWKLITNTWKIMIKSKESLYLKYCDVNNLYGWATPQKLPVNGLTWVKNTCQFIKDFIENYNGDTKDIFLKLMFNIPKTYMTFTKILHFYQKEWKLKKLKYFHDKRRIFYANKKFETNIK